MADTMHRTRAITSPKTRSVERHDLRGLLEPESLLARHGTAIARTCLPCLRAIDSGASPESRARQEQVHRKALEFMLSRSVTAPGLQAIGEALDEALAASPDDGVIEACLAALIDTRVKLPHNLPVYLEALIYDLRDESFPPAVVAAACQRIRRESVFLPEVSEVLAMCRETLARYREQRQRVAAALTDRRKAELWLKELDHSAEAETDAHPRT